MLSFRCFHRSGFRLIIMLSRVALQSIGNWPQVDIDFATAFVFNVVAGDLCYLKLPLSAGSEVKLKTIMARSLPGTSGVRRSVLATGSRRVRRQDDPAKKAHGHEFPTACRSGQKSPLA
ncbi:hypothetical protein M513_05445 [Trichuris suis]|nr:hypothetical protein M513_05445 [Trichuris suis]